MSTVALKTLASFNQGRFILNFNVYLGSAVRTIYILMEPVRNTRVRWLILKELILGVHPVIWGTPVRQFRVIGLREGERIEKLELSGKKSVI